MPASARVLRIQRAKEHVAFGARLTLDLLLIAIGAVAVWLLAIWVVGVLLVPAEGSAGMPMETRQALEPPTAEPSTAVLPAAEPYAFDGMPREIDGALACPQIGLIDYAGTSVRLLPGTRVAAPFREHLILLEQVTRATALRFYGRAPSALLIAASYDCRPVTRNSGRLSEHALGNAIDITAIRFDADPAQGEPALDVRVDRHWSASGDEQHARFLRALTQELIQRNVFRTLLGPAHPDHRDHFHFDMAPQHYVAL